MKYILESLRVSSLSNLEAGQLMRSLVDELDTIDPNIRTDEFYNNYVQEIIAQTHLYERALTPVRKNVETEKIIKADAIRDKGLSAFGIGLNLYAMSDDPAEVEASRVLSILFDTIKNLNKLNYSAESLIIDRLVSEYNSPAYSEKITFLQMNRYVTRLANANEDFKTLFGERMVTTALTEHFNMKAIRTELQNKYSDFVNYVLTMAKALNTPLFIDSLKLLNTERKYYSDMLARRIKKEDDPKATE